MFGKEKYISEFIHYQKLHFCTPVPLNRGTVWHTNVHQTIPGVYFGEGQLFPFYTGLALIQNFTKVTTLMFPNDSENLSFICELNLY